ncbi:unnamed protein product [Aphanomyces euteiches]
MFALATLAALFVGLASAAQNIKVGADRSLNLSAPANQVFSYIIRQEGATYIAPHFVDLDIPAGATLQISALDGSQTVKYNGKQSDFYAEYVRGSEAVVSYFPPPTGITTDDINTESVAFTVDRYASGFPTPDSNIEAICGADNTQAITCVKTSDPTKYQKAQAVARLLIGGNSLCTGWLFGSEGHLITNNHCIGNAATAKNVQFEFAAECATCSDPNNTKQLACPGVTVATSAQFIYTSQTLDFTLVKLNLKSGVSLSKYGYLQARESGPVLNEPIYIPQHPGGKPTRLATVLDSGKVGTVESLSIASCQADEIGYTLDTENGASGSPVLSTKDNAVVALHNCGGCLNGAIKINKVVSQLKSLSFLPANAVTGSRVKSEITKSEVVENDIVESKTDNCASCFYPGAEACLTDFTKEDCESFATKYGTVWRGD